jgi:hypothetical protein
MNMWTELKEVMIQFLGFHSVSFFFFCDHSSEVVVP